MTVGRSQRFGQAHRTSAECSDELWPNVICKDNTMCFTGECNKRSANVVVSKHVSVHVSSEMGNYVEKFQCIIHEQK